MNLEWSEHRNLEHIYLSFLTTLLWSMVKIVNLSVQKLYEAVCRYALFAPNRIFLSMEVEFILNYNILTWFYVVLFWKRVVIMYNNYML